MVFCYRNVLSLLLSALIYKTERWLLPRSWHHLNCEITFCYLVFWHSLTLNFQSFCVYLLFFLSRVSDISLEEVDVLKLAFFENNAKDKRYNRHTGFVSCEIVVSAYIGLWFRPILVCGFLKSLFYSYGLSPCLFRFFGNLRSIVVCVELVFWF